MNLNSPLFDRIRAKADPRPQPQPDRAACDHPGCANAGEYRAPMGREREGQYFCFCLDHVRQYNAAYNYFDGMNDEAMSQWMKDALTGHRPTWSVGRGAETGVARSGVSANVWRNARKAPAQRRYGIAATKALTALGLDDAAGPADIRARYKELVKRLHPDSNGGDRSCEDKLREIIHAYRTLKSANLA